MGTKDAEVLYTIAGHNERRGTIGKKCLFGRKGAYQAKIWNLHFFVTE